MPRRKLVAIHKWMGLPLAVYYCLQVVTGIMLTYKVDILHSTTPRLAVIDHANEAAALDQVLAALETAYPDSTAERINFPAADGLPFMARLEDMAGTRRWIQVDPAAGTAGPLTLPLQAMEFIRDFHINLVGGPIGHYIVGVTGIVLISSVVTGFILGWPGIKRMRNALRVSFQIPVTGWFQLHRLVGLATILIVFATAFTGTILVFNPQLQPLFVRSEPALDYAAGEPLPAAALFLRAQQEFPDARARSVRLKHGSAVYRVVISGDRNGMARPSKQVWLDPATGGVQKLFAAGNLAPGEAFFAWMYPLHVEFGLGRAGQLVNVIGAIGLLMLSVSGMLIWIKRRQMRLARRPAPQRAIKAV